MSHCHDEHHDHGHDHSEGAAHDHTDDLTPALQYSLYQHINFDQITTQNAATASSGIAIVKKTWDERMTTEPILESVDEEDPELLLRIPFTGQIRLHSLLIRCSSTSDTPKSIKLFINNEDLDCASANDTSALQELEVAQTNEVQELPVKRALFSRVQGLTLFIAENYGGGEEVQTRISYLGFRGDWMPLGKAPLGVLYEAAANPRDHKVKGTSVSQMGSRLG